MAAMVPVIVKMPPSLLAALDNLYPRDGLTPQPPRAEVIRHAVTAFIADEQRKRGHG